MARLDRGLTTFRFLGQKGADVIMTHSNSSPQSAEIERVVPDRLDGMQSTKTLFSERTGQDDPDWLRAWPFGPVHYSQDWPTRADGRFDTVCGKSPMYWAETSWPEQEVCPECRAWVIEHGTPIPMLYDSRPLSRPVQSTPAERPGNGDD